MSHRDRDESRELKQAIVRYLESRGWRNVRPTQYYGWDKQSESPADRERLFCWQAALVLQLADDEGMPVKMPAGAFEVVEGVRQWPKP